jgi:hypothetical protein
MQDTGSQKRTEFLLKIFRPLLSEFQKAKYYLNFWQPAGNDLNVSVI